MKLSTMRDHWVLRAVLAVLALAACGGTIEAAQVSQSVADALAAGDTTRAIQLLENDIKADPTYFSNYYQLGRIYFARGQFDQAKPQFELAAEKKRKDGETQYYLGLTYLRLGDTARAEEIMSEGRQKAKGQEKAMFESGFGQVMMARKQYQDADRAFRQALAIDPENPEYYIQLGDANFFQGIASLAVSNYEKALQTDTGSVEVYYHWAEACLEMKDYNCALEKLRIVLTRDSTHASAWARAAGIYFKAGLGTSGSEERATRFKETVGAYKRYFELSGAKPDSASVRAYFETGMAYMNLRGYEEAASYFEQVLAIPYEPRDIYLNYGKSLWYLKQYDKASEMLLKHEALLAAKPVDEVKPSAWGELYQFLGDAYYYRKPNDFSSAITYYKKALEYDSTNKRLLQNAGLAYHSLKSYGQALELYKRRIVYGIDSANATVLRNAGYCALNLAGGSEGEEEFDLEGDSGSEMIASTDSATMPVAANVDYFSVAADYFDQYLQLAPNDVKVLALSGNTYLYNLKDCSKGVPAFERVLALDPANCEAKRALGFAYFGGLCSKSYTRAIGYLQDAYECAVRNKGGCKDVSLILWIAQAYHLRAAEKVAAKESGKADFKAAFDWYGKVLACEPGNADAKKGQNDTRFEF